MRKGFQWSVTILIAVVLLIFSIIVIWVYIAGARPTQCKDGIDNDGDGLIDYPNDPECEGENDNSESILTLEKQFCDTDADCQGNPDGSKCLQTYRGDFKPFCGCIFNSDCGGYVCGSDDKCTKQLP
jgi:hypothetical protein